MFDRSFGDLLSQESPEFLRGAGAHVYRLSIFPGLVNIYPTFPIEAYIGLWNLALLNICNLGILQFCGNFAFILVTTCLKNVNVVASLPELTAGFANKKI